MVENKVLAKVDEREITERDVEQFLADIGPQMAMQFQSAEGKERIVEELVNQELLYLDALERKVDETEEYKELLKITEEKLLTSFALTSLVNDIEVTEEEMKNFFEENKASFAKPESAKASHILVDTEEEAVKALEEIKAGKSFEDAAAEYSSCPSKEVGGELGEFSRGQMVPEFEEVAFEMEAGTISEPVQTQFGYHLIYLDELVEVGTANYEDVKEQIAQQLNQQKQQEVYLEKISDLKEGHKIEIL